MLPWIFLNNFTLEFMFCNWNLIGKQAGVEAWSPTLYLSLLSMYSHVLYPPHFPGMISWLLATQSCPEIVVPAWWGRWSLQACARCGIPRSRRGLLGCHSSLPHPAAPPPVAALYPLCLNCSVSAWPSLLPSPSLLFSHPSTYGGLAPRLWTPWGQAWNV